MQASGKAACVSFNKDCNIWSQFRWWEQKLWRHMEKPGKFCKAVTKENVTLEKF